MTNREILIKLAEGKKFRRKDWGAVDYYIHMTVDGHVVNSRGVDYSCLSVFDDWQEVVEPLRWEGTCTIQMGDCDQIEIDNPKPLFPIRLNRKRCRVIVEEIV